MSTATTVGQVPPINALIWLSVKPILKLAGPAAAGFCLTKSGLFPVAGSRSASQIVLNVTLPSLLFSKIVPSFTPDNVKAIGPIVLVAVVYMGLSLVFAVILRTFTRTPKNFRWGLLAAGTWSNWGDLPTAVVSTVTLSGPFNGQDDSNLAVSFVAIFILVYYVTFFPCRGVVLVEMDYTHPPKEEDVEAAKAIDNGQWWKAKAHAKRVTNIPSTLLRRTKKRNEGKSNADEQEKNIMDTTLEERHNSHSKIITEKDQTELTTPALTSPSLARENTTRGLASDTGGAAFGELKRISTSRSIGSASVREMAGAAAAASVEETGQHDRARPFNGGTKILALAASERVRLPTIIGSRRNSISGDDVTAFDSSSGDEVSSRVAQRKRRLDVGSAQNEEDTLEGETFSAEENASGHQVSRTLGIRLVSGTKSFLLSLLTPPTISLLTGLICALVTKLKALFVVVPGLSFHPTAPDGDPPLAIILDTATFIGNASVPLGLMVLGSALARMRLPRPVSRLPIPSILGLAVAKLILLPIIGYLFVNALTQHTNLISADEKVLRFVLVYFSCVPTATTQVAVTQIFAPEDGENNSDILASYLIAQYLIFIFSSVVLTAVTLSSLS